MPPSRLRHVVNASSDELDDAFSDESGPSAFPSTSTSSDDHSSSVSRPISIAWGVDRGRPSPMYPISTPLSTRNNSPRPAAHSPSWNSHATLLSGYPPLASSGYHTRNSSFYSHMTRNFDERNMFTSPRSNELQDAIFTKLKMSPHPSEWAFNSLPSHPENDDELHDCDPAREREGGFLGALSVAGLLNVGMALVIVIALVALFAGYPVMLSYRDPFLFGNADLHTGVNGSGQVPLMPGNFGLIDKETPAEAHTIVSAADGSTLQLVFSDEFNTDGRTFYPGDDPYWEAVDLHYWETNNMEWYDPEAITTRNGSLQITLSAHPEHNLDYQGGMLQSWNKFCFTGGYIETSVILPGANDIQGLWPAIWTLGNLGRAGYGASLDGMWPYTYDTCDWGTLPNQTFEGQPALALQDGGAWGHPLSYLPGQRLSACTCTDGDVDHPGPKHTDGTWVGRNVPEIDVFEAQQGTMVVPGKGKAFVGQVSQSAQFAPFDMHYDWNNSTEGRTVYDSSITVQNSFSGSTVQEATSLLTMTNQDCYQYGTQCYSVYGFQYEPGADGYITWISDSKPAWTLNGVGVQGNVPANISQRLISEEPMSIILNLGMSKNFGTVDLAHIVFPVTMSVDYVRVYQHPDQINIGCDPEDFPTAAYIDRHIDAYSNANLTTWAQYGSTFPPNRLIDNCS